MGTSGARTLADQLRSWSGEQLGVLLEARPDLAMPAPGDSAQLAARASTRASVQRILDDLDHHQIATLEAVASFGPAPAPQIAALLRSATTDTVLGWLAERLLIWDDGRGLRAVSAVVEVLGVPAGPEATALPGLLDELDPPSRALLEHLDLNGSNGSLGNVPNRVTRASATTPAEQLLARGLLVARDARHVTLPWSVRLLFRDGFTTHESIDEPPALPTSDVAAGTVDQIAAGAASEVTRRVEVLLETWGSRPPATLRGGGLGVRDLRASASMLNLTSQTTGLLIETAAAAGLIAVGMTDDLDAAWLPTDRYDTWLGLPTPQRWNTLATAWLDMARRPSVIGTRVANSPVNALSDDVACDWLPDLRKQVFAELVGLPAGTGLAAGTGVAGLAGRLHWRRSRVGRKRDEQLTPLLEEAGTLGIIARGALSSFGRALVARGDGAAALLSLLPEPVDHILLQADLTAVAPGPLAAPLARQLALLADVESRGGATVYRFGTDSIRRAFDASWSRGEIHEFLAGASRTPVPQALDYLIDDVARRFGVVRAGIAESFLRSDDEVALTALMHHAEAESLRLRRIAPTVVISDVPLAQLLPRLRQLGLAPVVEAPDGTIRVARPDIWRSRTPKSRGTGLATARSHARTAAVVAAIRAGDHAAQSRPIRRSVSSPADVVAVLRSAAESDQQVLIGYVGSDGTVGERLVLPRRVEGGRLSAYDERTDDDREFAIHRITAVAPTE